MKTIRKRRFPKVYFGQNKLTSHPKCTRKEFDEIVEAFMAQSWVHDALAQEPPRIGRIK